MRKRTGKDIACHCCGTPFYVTKCRVGKAKFCSTTCSDAAQRYKRKKVDCARCGSSFTAELDHGAWQKYCGRECFLGKHIKRKVKKCASCSVEFTAELSSHNSSDGFKDYCSKKCAGKGLKNGVVKTCIHCGGDFYNNQATLKQRRDEGCCSDNCQREYYRGDKATNWKGGSYTDTGSGQIRKLHKRPDRVSPYMAEHRIIAGKAIGRELDKEFVIHINNVNDDNRPSNLFICESNSEFCRRRNGSLPWPNRSNLETYNLKGSL